MYDVDFSKAKDWRRSYESEGYLWNENLNMPEHRAVAYYVLHRFLLTSEQVHHIDHKKRNNEPANLVVLSERAHQIVHLWTMFGERGDRLKKATYLIEFLTSARITYIWLGGPE